MSADTIKREEGINYYSYERNYRTMQIPGHETVNIILYQGFVDKVNCGEGEGVDEVFAAAAGYANNVVADKNYAFCEEAAYFKELLITVKYYKEQLAELTGAVSRITDDWISKINPRKMTIEQRRQEINYAGQIEVVRKRNEVLNRLERFILNLMNGELSEEGIPFEEEDPESLFDSVELPVMTHMPEVSDIGKNGLVNNPLYQVLYNIVSKDVYAIVSLFHDYNNGNVCVRLWKKEDQDYKPCFCSISKPDVYLKHIGYGNENALWPGLIEAAAEQLGIPNDKRILAEAVLGPETENHDMDYIIGRNLPEAAFVPKDYDGAESEYARSLFEIYIVLLGNGSLFVKEGEEYVRVKLAVEELIDALYSCFDGNLERVLPSCKYLKEKIAEYEAYAQTAKMIEGAVVKKRKAAFNTLSKLLDLLSINSPYRLNPREYFEKKFTMKMAERLLNLYHKSLTSANIKAMTEKLYSNKAFRSAITKINVYTLDTAPQSIIEKMVNDLTEKR